MKQLFLTIFLFLSLATWSAGRYQIEYLNGDYITYKGKHLVKGDRFDDIDSLCWQTATMIQFIDTRTGNQDRRSEGDIDVKKGNSLWHFLLKINHGSSRTCDDYCMCSIMEQDVFVLEDTILFRIDDPDIIDVFTGALPQSALPQYFVTYTYNGETYTFSPTLDIDELIITRAHFAPITRQQSPITNHQSPIIIASIYSIDRFGRMHPISDSLRIELR